MKRNRLGVGWGGVVLGTWMGGGKDKKKREESKTLFVSNPLPRLLGLDRPLLLNFEFWR